uniref:Uncharacterized protein n=1 Tax=viral metagenome TaxID=1070528 RepID=A0A6C0BNH0_9ZZZZ
MNVGADRTKVKEIRLTDNSRSLQDLSEDKVRDLVYENNTEFVPPPGFNPLPVQNADQAFILYHVSHMEQRPRSRDPAFCLLGAFRDQAEAIKFAGEHYADSKFAVYGSPAHLAWPIRVKFEDQNDQKSNIEVADAIVKAHEAHVKKRQADHKRNVEERRTGTGGESIKAQLQKSREERVKDPVSQAKYNKWAEEKEDQESTTCRFTADKLILGQRFAVIIVLDDIRPATLRGEQEEEPLITFLFASDDAKVCADYGMYTASKIYKHCDLRVVAMYTWLFPTLITENEIGEIKIANERIQKIVNTQRDTDAKLAKFEEFYDENDLFTDLPAADLAPGVTDLAPGVADSEKGAEPVLEDVD